jgi:hypothetical protein
VWLKFGYDDGKFKVSKGSAELVKAPAEFEYKVSFEVSKCESERALAVPVQSNIS